MKYVGKCPNCQSDITVEFAVKPQRKGRDERDNIFKAAQPFVIQAIKDGFKTNGTIGRYVAEKFEGWKWKDPGHTLIGFVLTEMIRTNQLVRKPLLVEKGSYSHFTSTYELVVA